MTVIVDASVAMKWVLDEPGCEAAIALVAGERLAAPDLMFVECANVLWKKVRRGEIEPAAARQALAAIGSASVRVIAAQTHLSDALSIALELGQTAYDSLYLAVAVAERAMLVTADTRFAAAAQAHPSYARSVRILS